MLAGIMNKIIIPLFTSPIIGFLLGFIIMKTLNVLLKNLTPKIVNKWFSKFQIFSAHLCRIHMVIMMLRNLWEL